MDPLSALSVAGNVIQFIDFSCKLISSGQKLYSSANGTLVENLELEAIAESILQLYVKVKDSLGTASAVPTLVRLNRRGKEASTGIWSSKDEKEEERLIHTINENNNSIRTVCEQCVNVAIELVEALERLKVHGTNRKWKAFRQALRSIWDDKKIDGLVQRLQKLRAQLDSSILVALRYFPSIDSIDKRAAYSFRSMKIDEAAIQNSQVIAVVDNVMANTQVIQDTLLGHIHKSQQWQADVISAIYQSSWKAENRDHIHRFSSKLTGMVAAEWTKELELKLINRLQFPGMSDRKARIAEAYSKTFQWIYRHPEVGAKRWSNFKKWLESNEKLYWITGKPGSGKSTLMKFLYDNPLTWQHLRIWSTRKSLVAAGFFFWNSGSEMQMSSMGLLQTLLFNCLRQKRSLTSVIFPERWQACQSFGEDLHPWTWSELLQAFKLFIVEAGETSKLFFFIDGLDEFNGEHRELIELVQDISQFPNVKICLASRPWIVFEDAFGQLPSLMLQDLTYPDIQIFVEGRLVENSRFCQLKVREPQYASKLVKEITEKSAGVFLWINLVVRSLLEGLANSDRVSDLSRRLVLMPDDLDGVYKKILKSLDQFYFEHASQLFQIVRQFSSPISLLELSFADEEDAQMAIQAEIRPLTQEELEYRCDTMKRRLNSRCKGLLEVPALQPKSEGFLQHLRHQGSGSLQVEHFANLQIPSVEMPRTRSVRQTCSVESLYTPDELASLKVEYLHRTVKDFLEKPEIWKMILAATRPPFGPSASLARGFLMRLKSHNENKLTGDDNIWRAITCCWKYAVEAEINHDGSQMPLFRELERVATYLEASPSGTDVVISDTTKIDVITKRSAFLEQRVFSKSGRPVHNFSRGSTTYLSFQAQCELYQSVLSQLRAGYLIAQDCDGRPLLTLAVLEFEPFSVLGLRLIKLLLTHGASVNQPYQNSTPWKDVIAQASANSKLEHIHSHYNLLMERWAEIVELFIRNGADVEMEGRTEGVDCIRSVFWKWSAARTEELEEAVYQQIGTGRKNSRLSRLFSLRKAVGRGPGA